MNMYPRPPFTGINDNDSGSDLEYAGIEDSETSTHMETMHEPITHDVNGDHSG